MAGIRLTKHDAAKYVATSATILACSGLLGYTLAYLDKKRQLPVNLVCFGLTIPFLKAMVKMGQQVDRACFYPVNFEVMVFLLLPITYLGSLGCVAAGYDSIYFFKNAKQGIPQLDDKISSPKNA